MCIHTYENAEIHMRNTFICNYCRGCATVPQSRPGHAPTAQWREIKAERTQIDRDRDRNIDKVVKKETEICRERESERERER